MSPKTTALSLALAGLCASTLLAGAQTSGTVAYVYVASSPSAGPNTIHGYYASSTGALTAMPGSPYAVAKCKVSSCGVGSLALNGKWLFGTDGYDIDVYSMAANGALKQTATDPVGFLDNSQNPPIPAGGPGSVFLDHTGATLYDAFINLNGTENNGYQAYAIDEQNGKISLINQVSGGPEYGSTLTFASNNEFAYSSSCYHGTPDIFGFQRMKDGGLATLNESAPFPKPYTGYFYCPYLAAAAPSDHLAVAVQSTPDDEYQGSGPYQIASYTVNASNGNLTTTNNTYANMPSAKVGQPYVYWLSPDGKYLAVGGANGLQVFHFNGAAPLTAFTGLLTGDAINQLWWDSAGHLYAVDETDGKLFVFSVTAAGATAAPGSPHAIAGAAGVMVMSK